MRRHRHPFHRLVPLVLASFLCFLTQPQIATLHHDHRDGEYLHTHTNLFVSLIAALTHSHHDDHDHVHGIPHTHAPARKYFVPHATRAYIHPDSLERGHSHTFTALHQAQLVSTLQQFSQRNIQSLPLQEWKSFHAAFPARFHSRAPPVTF